MVGPSSKLDKVEQDELQWLDKRLLELEIQAGESEPYKWDVTYGETLNRWYELQLKEKGRVT